MGTRADFYMGRGIEARWLGSVAFDGYPGSRLRKVVTSPTEAEFELRVAERTAENDGTRPEQGWPWPWEDSRTTDFAYAFDDGKVFIANFGYNWRTLPEWEAYEDSGEDEPRAPKQCVFPDMTERQQVTLGPRSGLIVLGLKGEP
jgi:hypothetical protein